MTSMNLFCKHQVDNVVANYNDLKSQIDHLHRRDKLQKPQILIASKYFDKILLEQFIKKTKHKLFGENIVQDAELKWKDIIQRHPDIKLHFIGKLQSNKIKAAVKLFHTIETVSSIKTALIIKNFSSKLSVSTPDIYLQINIGAEQDKNGLTEKDFPSNFKKINEIIHVSGLMCILPQKEQPLKYFKKMTKIAQNFSIKKISMGMSNSYKEAIKYGSTQIRVGRILLSNK